MIHFAVAGVAGSGKSSLINALRGLSNNDPRAAPVGTAETTREIHRYEDSDVAQNQFVWYDIPGAGTLNQASEVDYFRKQGLYIFDCIILLVDSRFTATDVAILRCCSQTKTPVYIVRSKALQHICNPAEDMVGDGRGNADGWDTTQLWEAARTGYIRDTKQTVDDNLRAAGLDDQRVYIVDRKTMLRLVTSRTEQSPSDLVHEEELLVDVLIQMGERRRNNAAAPPSPTGH